MKRFFACLCITALAVAVCGCSEKDGSENDKPVIEVTPTSVEADAAGGTFDIEWTVKHPAAGVALEARTADGWIENIVVSEAKITFDVQPNDGEARNGVIAISYAGADEVACAVSQQAMPAPRYGCVTFEGEYWNALIDSPQYGGALLYGESDGMGWYVGVEAYEWQDEATHLHSALNEAYGAIMYSNGGFAISNYASTELAADGADKSFEQQLEVYGTGGHDGSATFAVANGYESEWMSGPSFDFADGVARSVAEAWIAPTTYCAAAAAKMGVQELWIEASGFDAAGETTGTAKFSLCQGGKFIDGWTKWDLTSLGKATKVSFTVVGDETAYDDYGLAAPAYFAIDDIKICMD